MIPLPINKYIVLGSSFSFFSLFIFSLIFIYNIPICMIYKVNCMCSCHLIARLIMSALDGFLKPFVLKKDEDISHDFLDFHFIEK